MRRLLPFVALFGFLVGCKHAEDGTVKGAIDVGSRERTFVYHEPSSWSADQKWPLVVALHGRMGDGIGQEHLTHMSRVADREGFIVVYPDGFRRSWHDDRNYGPAAEHDIDDVAFISALIDRFVNEHSADPERVYVTGTSNGAFMSFKLACELSDKIAAVGPVVGLMPENAVTTCKPARPVPMMMFVGTEDPLVPYGGGDVADDHGRALSAQDTRARWATLNGCDDVDFVQTIDAVDDDTRVSEARHSHCKEEAEVVLFSVEGGGHTWPNGVQYLPAAVIGKTTRDVDASEELWSFFRTKRRAPR